MPVDPSLQPKYDQNLFKYDDPRTQGNWVDIYSNKNRYVNGQFLTNQDLELGIFVAHGGVEALYGSTLVVRPTAAGQKILGVNQINPTKLLTWDATLKLWRNRPGDQIAIATTGNIFMYSEVPVEVGDPVFFRYAAAGAFTRLYTLSNAAGAGLEAYPRAKFAERLKAPGVVAVTLFDD